MAMEDLTPEIGSSPLSTERQIRVSQYADARRLVDDLFRRLGEWERRVNEHIRHPTPLQEDAEHELDHE